MPSYSTVAPAKSRKPALCPDGVGAPDYVIYIFIVIAIACLSSSTWLEMEIMACYLTTLTYIIVPLALRTDKASYERIRVWVSSKIG
jgi:hypothetical protein